MARTRRSARVNPPPRAPTPPLVLPANTRFKRRRRRRGPIKYRTVKRFYKCKASAKEHRLDNREAGGVLDVPANVVKACTGSTKKKAKYGYVRRNKHGGSYLIRNPTSQPKTASWRKKVLHKAQMRGYRI